MKNISLLNQTITELESNFTLSEDDGMLSETIYAPSKEDPSSRSVTTPSGAVSLILGGVPHIVNSGGNADATNGREEALLNRSSVLFVAVSFILLMVISLAWLVFYYVQRFRYIHSKEQVSRRLAELARKAVARIPVKTLHSDDKETNSEVNQCAICIEPFRPLDNIRILPCRHYFHKLCIDPWLLEQRSCPMCKLDILQAYGLRTDFCSYPVASESGPGAGAGSRGMDSGALPSSSTGAARGLGLPSGSEEEGLEHVSLLVHHSNAVDADLIDPGASGIASPPAPLDGQGGESRGKATETRAASADWWSVVSDSETRSAALSPPTHWSNLLGENATVSLSDQHLAPTGLLLAPTATTERHQFHTPAASLTLSDAMALTATDASLNPRRLCVDIGRDEVSLPGHPISEFYHIDDPKTEDVTVTGACSGFSSRQPSMDVATGPKKKQRPPGHKHTRSPFMGTLSSFFVGRLRSPWSLRPNRASPVPTSCVATEGHLGDASSIAAVPSLSFSKPFLPPAMMSFHSPQSGGPSANTPSTSAALSDGDFRHDNQPVGSECVVVAVIEPAPSNGGDVQSVVCHPSPHSSLSSRCSTMANTNTATDQGDESQQVFPAT